MRTCEPFLTDCKTYSASRGRKIATRCHSVFETHSSCGFFQDRFVATERTVNLAPLFRVWRCSGSVPIRQLLEPAKKYSWWPRPFREHLGEVLNSDDYKDDWKGKKEDELLGRIAAVFLARMEAAEVTQTDLIAGSEQKGFAPEESIWDKVRDLHPHVALCQAIDQVINGN
jgi:hypothetical protein